MDYEQFAANLRGEIPKLKTQELEKTKAATEPIGYSNQEAFYAGLLGLAPLLAGVIKGGKKNIAAGAEAGLLGTQLFGSDKKEKDKEAKTRLAAEAQLLTDERKSKEKSLAALEQAGAIKGLEQENAMSLAAYKSQLKRGEGGSDEDKLVGDVTKGLANTINKDILTSTQTGKNVWDSTEDVLDSAYKLLQDKSVDLDESWGEAGLRNVKASVEQKGEIRKMRAAQLNTILEKLGSLSRTTEKDMDLIKRIQGAGSSTPIKDVIEAQWILRRNELEKVAANESLAEMKGLPIVGDRVSPIRDAKVELKFDEQNPVLGSRLIWVHPKTKKELGLADFAGISEDSPLNDKTLSSNADIEAKRAILNEIRQKIAARTKPNG